MGEVVACAREGLDLFFLVEPLAKVGQVTRHAAKFRRASGLFVWQAADVRQCLAWRVESDGLVLVVGL